MKQAVKAAFVLFLVDLFIFDGRNVFRVTLQDVVSIMAFIVVGYHLFQQKDLRKKYISPYVLYFMYLIISNLLINLVLISNSVFPFYILKEVIYFLIMITAYLFTKNNRSVANNVLECIVVANILYGIYSVLTGVRAYYGIGSINSPAPSQSGIIYFGCVMLGYYLYLDLGRRKYIAYTLLSALLVAFTVSRTAMLGLVSFFVASVVLKILWVFGKRQKVALKSIIALHLTLLLLGLCVVMVSYTGGINYSSDYLATIVTRLGALDSSMATRLGRLELFRLDRGNDIFKFMVGYGKGTPELLLGRTGLAVDNQYFRLYLEMGVIGTFLWSLLLIKTIINVMRNQSARWLRFSIAFTLSYLAMGFGFEIFQVTKAGTLFWLVQGLMISASEDEHASYNRGNRFNLDL